MAIQITRHFATVKGERQVHYRRAGSGPPVVLLHQSPTSSREYIPLIQEIAAKGFTVFSPDTPGNGMSEPFPGGEWKSMEGFADGVVNLMDELGLSPAEVVVKTSKLSRFATMINKANPRSTYWRMNDCSEGSPRCREIQRYLPRTAESLPPLS